MSWRDRAKPSEPEGDKPSLETLLDHYGVTYAHRWSQMVCCPLHLENTPSCSINLSKQLWKCHSCGAGGDVWTLIERMEGKDFAGAREFAATTLGFTAGSSGGSDGHVRGGSRSGRRGGGVSARKGDRAGGGTYKPSWRRGD